ncbi:hypothetical protein JK359_18430 [Streptomyces actinomycinicus]|uniref:Uncharacterized protein n=1 Tax=Streptomyces actinomycinicus TaxID=1695166 RepID=A0A937JPX4_9ACTN|nr:hypothetical protein [Streptomyces actinomycinicus]MBL1083922.1 hypothetical protein [Streptomyces actinomycinicus]
MTSTLKRFATAASTIGLLGAGVTLGIAPSAQAVPGGPTGCTAYVSHTNEHVAVGWCRSGSGTWNVQAYCGGPGGARGPYKGTEGYRTRGMEKAATLNCGSSGFPYNMKVVDVR